MKEPHSVPTPAATVVPLRDGRRGLEVLLLRRAARGAFAGMWVFPGGQLDPVDQLSDHDDEIAVARRAAAREAEEEAGLRLDPDLLVALSHWLPPMDAPRRFSTWFFLAPMAERTTVAIDGREIRDHGWMSPSEALARRDRGEIDLAPPTWMTLWWLRQHPDLSSALDAARRREAERFFTRVVLGTDNQRTLLWAGDAGYEDGDVERPGRRRRLLTEDGHWRAEVSD